MSKYYIAYGSNMNITDMKRRCPTAKMIGTLHLTGYMLMFNEYATIVKSENSKIPTVIWEITEEDEEKLDRYEGFPKLYHKEYLPFRINKVGVEGMVYVMNNFVPMPPTKQYFNTILDSYKEFEFNVKPLKEALSKTIVIGDLYDDELSTDFVNSYFHGFDM